MNQKIQDEAREKIAKIVDDALVYEALIVLDLDREKVKAIKDWSQRQIDANYALRTSTVNQILSLSGETDEVCDECKGSGETPTYNDLRFGYHHTCDKCIGTGHMTITSIAVTNRT